MVALFARAWIEMPPAVLPSDVTLVALFARAWIEMYCHAPKMTLCKVALFARAWIEMELAVNGTTKPKGRPLCEGVD